MERSISIREMVMADYAAVIDLMRRAPGVSVRDADSAAAIARFLERNPGLSFVAERDGGVLGCLMSGHDGRRGYLYHLAVDAACRRQGVATALVERCLGALERLDIHKMHVDVYRNNTAGESFWRAAGWLRRDELHRFSIIKGGSSNA